MRRDQKGYTIAELLIAVTILTIVVASVCGFIIVGSRSYAAGNSDINTQQEAQLALNQMSDVLIDTTRSVIYAAYNTAGTPEQALKDAEFGFTPEDKSLIMFNGTVVKSTSGGPDTIEAGNGNKHYHFYWSKAKETLFYAEQELNDPLCVDSADILAKFPDVADADPDADPETTKWYVLAQHVTDFSADLSQVEEKRVVQLALTFVDGTKEYVTSNNVTIRNKVGVNDAELAPLNRSVEIEISVKSSFILEPGETFVLPTPKVTGKNVTDKSVTWSFGNPAPADNGDGAKNDDGTWKYETTLTADGILKLADRAKGSFKVKATTNAEDSEHNQATAEVTIYVKRVTGIDLWKSYDSANMPEHQVARGSTFTISGRVKGDYLDQTCDCCGEDTVFDRQILSTKSPKQGNIGPDSEHVWRVWDPHKHASQAEIAANGWENWHPSQDIIEVDQDEFSATFTVAQNVSDAGDHGYVIQVMSLLSYYRWGPGWKERAYPWVWPSYDFTVEKPNSDITAGGTLHWGASTEISWEELSPYHYYVICARVREQGTTGGDKIMMYLSEGTSTRVTPDMFGVEDVSKPWDLSLQVLNPGKEIPPGVGLSDQLQNDVGALVNDPTVLDMIDDYLNHCDASGTYIGTKYLHSGKLKATINPPEIFYAYNGQENLGGELELKPVSTLGGPAWTQFGVDYVKNTRDETLGNDFANENIRFSMYRETADGGLKEVYWYNSATGGYEGEDKPYGGVLELTDIKNPKTAIIKLDFNRKERFSEAEGKYQLIPTIIYEQGSWADHCGGASVYYVNYQPQYNTKQCYKDKRSIVHFELKNGGNVDAFWSYNNEFTKGEIYFPTPSESGFSEYFDRETIDSSWQYAKNLTSWGPSFTKTIEGRNDTTTYQAASLRCCYVAGKYKLELFYEYYDSMWNRKGKVSAGVFQCAADGDRWEQVTPGAYDSQLEKGNKNPQLGPTTLNVEFDLWGRHYNGRLYIPLPSESAFSGNAWNELGFGKSEYPTFMEKENVSLKYQPQGSQNTEDVTFPKVKCTYNAKTDMYGLILTFSGGTEDVIAGFKIKSDGEQWTSPWMPWDEPK